MLKNNDDDEILNELNNEFGSFPQHVIDKISEFSPEGFLLFIVNERGEVELFSQTSAEIIDAGLRSKALKLLSSMSALEDIDIANQIRVAQQGGIAPEDDGEDFGS